MDIEDTMDIMPICAQNVGQTETPESAPNWQNIDPKFTTIFNPQVNQATINIGLVNKNTLYGTH